MTLLGLSVEPWSIILVSIIFMLLWGQVLILHYRGAFRRIWMWEPILYLPVVVVLGFIAVIARGVFLQLYWVALILALLMGVSGFVFHIQGVIRQAGGWNLDNLMVGPPPLLPLSISFISLLGMIAAILWGRA